MEQSSSGRGPGHNICSISSKHDRSLLTAHLHSSANSISRTTRSHGGIRATSDRQWVNIALQCQYNQPDAPIIITRAVKWLIFLITLIHSLIHFWHAPLWVLSARRRHHSLEWTILSHVNCFIQGEVQWFQVLLGSLHPRSTGASQWYPAVLQGRSC